MLCPASTTRSALTSARTASTARANRSMESFPSLGRSAFAVAGQVQCHDAILAGESRHLFGPGGFVARPAMHQDHCLGTLAGGNEVNPNTVEGCRPDSLGNQKKKRKHGFH